MNKKIHTNSLYINYLKILHIFILINYDEYIVIKDEIGLFKRI